jgi:predicted Zn-dependent peptidase
VGPVPHRELADACAMLADLEPGTPAVAQRPRHPAAPHQPETRWENPLWALPTPGWSDPQFPALLLADQLLAMRAAGSGDCALGSRLTLFSDAGLLLVEAAAPPERRPACRQAVDSALRALAAGTVTGGDLRRAAAALHTWLAADTDPLRLMHRLGRELWYLPRVPDRQERLAALAAITPADLEHALAAGWRDRVCWP